MQNALCCMQDAQAPASDQHDAPAPSEEAPEHPAASQIPDTQAVFASMEEIGGLAAAFPGTQAPPAGLTVPDSIAEESQDTPAARAEAYNKGAPTVPVGSAQLPAWLQSKQADPASAGEAPKEAPPSPVRTWNRRPRQGKQQQRQQTEAMQSAADQQPAADDVYQLPASEPQKEAAAAASAPAPPRTQRQARGTAASRGRGRGRAMRSSSRLAVTHIADFDPEADDQPPSSSPSPATEVKPKSEPSLDPKPEAVSEPVADPKPSHEVRVLLRHLRAKPCRCFCMFCCTSAAALSACQHRTEHRDSVAVLWHATDSILHWSSCC